jgi:hypothetical protein
VVERLLARHRHGERTVSVRGFDLLYERVCLVVVEERDRDDGRVPILGDETRVCLVEVGPRAAESRDLAVLHERPYVVLESL